MSKECLDSGSIYQNDRDEKQEPTIQIKLHHLSKAAEAEDGFWPVYIYTVWSYSDKCYKTDNTTVTVQMHDDRKHTDTKTLHWRMNGHAVFCLSLLYCWM